MKKLFCLFILVFTVCFVCERRPALADDILPCLTIAPDTRARERSFVLNDEGEVIGVLRGVSHINAVWNQQQTVAQETGSTLILRVRFLDGTDDERALVRRIAPEWSKYANIRFEFVENDASGIRIGFDPNDGNWSYVGSGVAGITKTMNLAIRGSSEDGKRRVILHEFGHALSLNHEHQNPAVSIQWDEKAIIEEITRIWGWPEAKIRRNILNPLDREQTNFTEFDPDSIMLYPIPNRWTIGDFETDYNTALSATDKHFIGTIYDPNFEYRPNFDPNLRAKIEQALGKASGATITVADMLSLTRLNAHNANIRVLTGLEYATNLTFLSLFVNNVTDISPVARLTKLTRLQLGHNNITDISTLAGLTNLTRLELLHNNISDISVVTGLTQLTYLRLESNSISDISPVAGLTNLTYLNFKDNSILDISVVTNLTKLTNLYLDENSISDISALAGLTNLIYLELNDNNISDISVLAGLNNLTWLNLNDSTIVDISPLVSNTGLGRGDSVSVRENPLSAVSINTHIPTLQGRGVDVRFDPPSHAKGDVNRDGVVNIQDLVLAARRLGQRGQNDADMNGDGVVNIQDLVLVAGAFGNTGAAPAFHPQTLTTLTAADVQGWLTEAEQMVLTTPAHLRGIAVLEQLLSALTPKETVLLPNYPNPFNPETWIPYQLAEPAEVTLSIYATNGQTVRTLAFGHQAAGFYESRYRAAYWDGRNAQGEPVASGVYFYHLSAGDYSATRRMVIVK